MQLVKFIAYDNHKDISIFVHECDTTVADGWVVHIVLL